ncbi:MAG TPA: hypothetical protein VGB00_12100 [Pyrinomonadaceae bacterium]|jgi:hypothetical protein
MVQQSIRTVIFITVIFVFDNLVQAQTPISSPTGSSSLSSDITKIIITALVGCLFGILTAFFTSLFTARWKLREITAQLEKSFEFKQQEITAQFKVEMDKERAKWAREREDAIGKELRLAVLQLTVKMASALHSMCWLTWGTSEYPDRISSEKIKIYDDELHKGLPEISGSLVSVAALDRGTYDLLHPIVEEFYKIDARIGEAAQKWEKSPPEGRKKFADCYKEAVNFDKDLPNKIADIVSNRIEQRASLISGQQ